MTIFAYFLYCIYTYIGGEGQKCLKICLRNIWMAPSKSTCLSRFKVDPLKSSEVCGIVLKLFHGKVIILAQKCAIMLGLLNCLMNPIIYVFWYSQFRIRIVQTWKNFFVMIVNLYQIRRVIN